MINHSIIRGSIRRGTYTLRGIPKTRPNTHTITTTRANIIINNKPTHPPNLTPLRTFLFFFFFLWLSPGRLRPGAVASLPFPLPPYSLVTLKSDNDQKLFLAYTPKTSFWTSKKSNDNQATQTLNHTNSKPYNQQANRSPSPKTRRHPVCFTPPEPKHRLR
jgi:hypothetical protein